MLEILIDKGRPLDAIFAANGRLYAGFDLGVSEASEAHCMGDEEFRSNDNHEETCKPHME